MDGVTELLARTTLEDSTPVSKGKPFADTASKLSSSGERLSIMFSFSVPSATSHQDITQDQSIWWQICLTSEK